MVIKTLAFSSELDSAYDQSTYIGRLVHFIRFTSPRNAMYTKSDIEKCQKLLKEYKEKGELPGVSEKELWNAKYAVISNTHADTGELIPRIFRMSYFVPCNVPIAIGLSLSAPTVFNTIFWQFVNQSYNFGVNVANGNKSNATNDIWDTVIKFGLAVGSSITISLTARRMIQRSRFKDNYVFQRVNWQFAPFLGVAGANTVNLFTARYSDTKNGIAVKDAKTNEILEGQSPKAGQISFWQTLLSRVLIPFPVSFFPPIMVSFFTAKNLMPKGPIGNQFFNIGISSFTLMCALPIALACFPQEVSVKATDLEPRFHTLYNSKNEKVEYINFNRGL